MNNDSTSNMSMKAINKSGSRAYIDIGDLKKEEELRLYKQQLR